MFELNDIKGMQREVARCAELKELLDQGLHDEALGEMMGDTTMDFHQFNATKYQMSEEGLWSYETLGQKMKRLAKEAKDQGLNAQSGSGTTESIVRKKLIVRRIFDEQRKWDLQHTIIDFGQKINWHGSTDIGSGGDGGGMGGRDKVSVNIFFCNNLLSTSEMSLRLSMQTTMRLAMLVAEASGVQVAGRERRGYTAHVQQRKASAPLENV